MFYTETLPDELLRQEKAKTRALLRRAEVERWSQQADHRKVLSAKVAQHNKAFEKRDLQFLRSFLSQVVLLPRWAAAKPILYALNGPDPASCVPLGKALLSQCYDSADDKFVMGQIGAFVKKYPFVGNRQKAEKAGMSVFETGERRNRHMNALIRRRRNSVVSHVDGHGHANLGFDTHWSTLSVRKHLQKLLGDAPVWDGFEEGAYWGKGANVGVNGQFTNFARKLLAGEWTVTPACLPIAISVARRLPMFWEVLGLAVAEGPPGYIVELFDERFLQKCKIVSYNKISLARKDADKDRTIASEPLLNQLCQMAADRQLRNKLGSWGINLRDQSRNQLKAWEGSLGGFNPPCTIDLKNASGSICAEVPRELLPRGWWSVLNAIRSPEWMYDSKVTRYHGFVSMGNGFCFALQTLIFSAICLAAHEYCRSKPDFLVYGDDIVVRQSEALVVLEILRRFGFAANTDKTFLFGPFRESCGADWHSGVDVRPAFFDDPLDVLGNRFKAHNALTRLPDEGDAEYLSDCMYRSFPDFCESFVRPYPGDTDEAIDGRFKGPVGPRHWDYAHQCAAWYGLSVRAKADEDIAGHEQFPIALRYAALQGASSSVPFAERRETRVTVARFGHCGVTSTWTPREENPVISRWFSSWQHFPRVFCGEDGQTAGLIN